MNEKFFDLKKEKQDRMINAALKIFASAGYEHASTDDIVREAKVSKGLLFHYFISKLGLYTFLYDYTTRYEQLEYSTNIGKEETDYFGLRARILHAQASCMRNYPYLPLFIDRADHEENEEASHAIGTQIITHAEQIRAIYERADLSRFREDVDAGMVGKMLNGAFRGILVDVLRLGNHVPESYEEACSAYLTMMKKLCYREDGQETEQTVQPEPGSDGSSRSESGGGKEEEE